MVGQNQKGGRLMRSKFYYIMVMIRLAVFVSLLLAGAEYASAQVSRHRAKVAEGFTEPFQTVRVASPESGVLQSLSVREGQRVQAGQIIATLDSQVLAASLAAAQGKRNARGKVNGAKTALENKRHQLTQMQQLFEKEHASDKEVKQAQLAFDLATATLEEANDGLKALEMDVKQIEARLERRIVRSPIDGTVLELPRQQGEAITASESQVATIVALDQLRIRFFLATDHAARIAAAKSIQVHFPDSGQQAVGNVDFVSPVTDSKSGTVRVELLIDNRSQSFRSGVRCVLGEPQPVQSVSFSKTK
jgi:RND family efflux transporter MFP subunit